MMTAIRAFYGASAPASAPAPAPSIAEENILVAEEVLPVAEAGTTFSADVYLTVSGVTVVQMKSVTLRRDVPLFPQLIKISEPYVSSTPYKIGFIRDWRGNQWTRAKADLGDLEVFRNGKYFVILVPEDAEDARDIAKREVKLAEKGEAATTARVNFFKRQAEKQYVEKKIAEGHPLYRPGSGLNPIDVDLGGKKRTYRQVSKPSSSGIRI